jgi:hypothetical protein
VSIERTYEGQSMKNNLQEALQAALDQLVADLPEGGVQNPRASWRVTECTGEYGGIVPSHVKVKIKAKRSPKWGPG